MYFLENISTCFTLFLFQIPRAESVYYEKLTNMISFKAANYPLHLTGKLETWSPSGGWQHLRTVSLKAKPFTFNLSPEAHFSNLRLRLCLESNELLCGAYSEASVVDRIEEAALLGSSGHVWLLAVIVGGLVSGLVTLILLIKMNNIAPRKSKSSIVAPQWQLFPPKELDVKTLENAQQMNS